MDFVVRRDDFSQCKFVDSGDAEAIGPGQAVLRVTKFAFTANNVTYAVAGDMLSYWNFFPAGEGWGRIPVWGIGVVEQSMHPGLAEGERFFGYFPMSNTLSVEAEKVSPQGFVDGSPHRRSLPPTYNQYSRMTAEAGFDPAQDDQTMIFWPLFMTSFLLDDFLVDSNFFGAGRVVLSSASSKTAFGLAFLLARREGIEAIGLTSPSNRDFVEGLGCYDLVLTYDDIDSLPNDQPVVFVDMAGNGEVIGSVHQHLADELKYSCMVGITHWQQSDRPADLPGPEPVMFFAPDRIVKRTEEWGPGGIQERFQKAWAAFMEPVAKWITIVHGEGQEDVERVYLETLKGKAKPNEGYILSM